MMEPLEARRLMSAGLAPLATTAPPPPPPTPPAQDLYLDPFVVLSLDGHRLSKSAVVNFGQVAQNGAPITKTLTAYYSQNNTFHHKTGTNTGGFPGLGGYTAPPGFIAALSIGPDDLHGTLTLTFTPSTPGIIHGPLVISLTDGSHYVIAVNLKVTVLPTAAVSVSRIDMARLPEISGSIHAINGKTHTKGLAHVQLTNSSSDLESGETTVNLYASLSDTLDTNDAVLLGTGTSDISIKAGRTKPVLVHYDFPETAPSGDYHIFAVAAGSTFIAASGAQYLSPILQPIQAPEINLSGIATQSPAFLTRDTTRITVPIANTGNVHAQAGVQLNIYTLPPASEPGASSSPSLLGTFDVNYSIDPNRKAIHPLQLGHTVQAGYEILAVITAVHLAAADASIDTTVLPDSFAVR